MGLSKNLRRSTRTEIIRREKQSGLDEFRSVFSGSRAASRRRDGMCRDAVRAGVRRRLARFHAVGFIRLHVLCVWLELPLRYAVWETVRAHFQRGTSFRSMQPPLLVRALREHCALLLCAAAHGLWATLGGRCPPKTPWQEPEVPAPPTSAQTHAAALARPRFARTLRVSSVRCGARAMGYVRGTLSP